MHVGFWSARFRSLHRQETGGVFLCQGFDGPFQKYQRFKGFFPGGNPSILIMEKQMARTRRTVPPSAVFFEGKRGKEIRRGQDGKHKSTLMVAPRKARAQDQQRLIRSLKEG